MSLDDLARLTPDLATLGWNDDLESWATEIAVDPGQRGRVAQVSRGYSVVFTGGDAVLAASASIRTETGTLPATGDFVVVTPDPDDPDDKPILAAIAPRRTALTRRASGRVPEPQVLAANIDSVFVMHGLDREANLRRIERQLVLAWDSGAEPVVLLTKADTVDDAHIDAEVDRVSKVAPGVEVVAVSTVDDRGVDRVAQRIGPGRTVALLGLSGIGKSTLVNRITGGVVQRTGEVRATDRRGRHTTVTRDLIPLPDGGFMIDTPGVREFGLWQAYDGLDRTFPEIAGEVPNCRFADCDHADEPGCAIRAGVADGLIPVRRLEHWRDLQEELVLQETQLTEHARRSESRDRAEAERRRDDERSNTKRRSRSAGRRRKRQSRRR